jgi:hypothetical protein
MHIDAPFSETTSGVTLRGGEEHPFTLRVSVEALPALLRDGRALVTGTLDAEGLATAQPVTGTLTITHDAIPSFTYDLAFTTDDGRPCRMTCTKDLDVGDPAAWAASIRGRIDDPAGAWAAIEGRAAQVPGAPDAWRMSDIWSIGVVVYLLLHGYPPFNAPHGQGERAIYAKLREASYRFRRPG